MRLLKIEFTASELSIVMAVEDDYIPEAVIDGLVAGMDMWGFDIDLLVSAYIALDTPLPAEFPLPDYLPFFGKDLGGAADLPPLIPPPEE